MMPDHLVDDEAQELFGEFGVEVGFLGQLAQARDLAFLATGVRRGERVFGLVAAHRLGGAKAFGKDVDQRGIEVIDGAAKAGQHGIGRGRLFGHCPALA